MNLNIFKPEDFKELIGAGDMRLVTDRLAAEANRLLAERKEQLTKSLEVNDSNANESIELQTAGARIRSIGYLIASHDSDVGEPPAFNFWYHIGSLLEELGTTVLEVSDRLEES